jgi:hypothetical protein
MIGILIVKGISASGELHIIVSRVPASYKHDDDTKIECLGSQVKLNARGGVVFTGWGPYNLACLVDPAKCARNQSACR